MPSLSPSVLAPQPVHGFLPAFFTPYVPDAAPSAPTPDTMSEPRVSYLPEPGFSHGDFCNSEQFARYREQMRETLDLIHARAVQLGMPDTDEIGKNLRTLYRHRFEVAFFDTHAELIDSAGKRALDNFRAMLDDPRLPPRQQRTAIRNLSAGVAVCASGTVANLIAADRDLSLSVGGLCGKLWQAKEDTARGVLQQVLSEHLAEDKYHEGNEIHYIDMAWNHIADAVGLNRIPDWFVLPMDADLLASCKDKVLEALTPDKLAKKIAEDCLSEFRSRTVFDPESPSVPCDQAQTEWLNMVARDILRDLGLTENQLNLHAFARLDDDCLRYHMRDDPSLIALALLKAMDADHLLADMPCRLTEVLDQDGERAELYSYGSDLVWRLRQSMRSADAASWQAHDDVDVIDGVMLRAWPAWPDAVPPPAAAYRHALRPGADPADLMSVRADWLGSPQAIVDLLNRLESAQATRYLDGNLPYLLKGLPVDERVFFIDAVMHMGEPVQTLLRAWYPDPWVFLGERRQEAPDPWAPPPSAGTANGSPTRLERWIATGNAGAIDALCGFIGEGWPANEGPAFLDIAIAEAFGGDKPSLLPTMLASVDFMHGKRSVHAVEAWQRLLRRLVSLPDVGIHIASRLPAIFSGTGGHRPSVLIQMFRAHPMMTAAVRRMLFDPLIKPHIEQALPAIFLGDDSLEHEYPIWGALRFGNTDRLEEYGALWSAAAQVPGMQKSLPILLTPNRLDSDVLSADFWRRADHDPLVRIYGLVAAAQAGAVTAIKTFHAILTQPAIYPHVRTLLGGFMLGDARKEWWPEERKQMLRRMFRDPSPGYAACREMMADPLILPEVLKALPSAEFLEKIDVPVPYFLFDAANPPGPGERARRLARRVFRRFNL